MPIYMDSKKTVNAAKGISQGNAIGNIAKDYLQDLNRLTTATLLI